MFYLYQKRITKLNNKNEIILKILKILKILNKIIFVIY